MRFNVLTIFTEVFDSYLGTSILKRAQTEGLIEAEVVDIRRFAEDKHKTVDDTPYGGGAGMILKVEPIDKALAYVKKKRGDGQRSKTVVLSARGEVFDQKKAEEYAKLDELTLICGRYEGIDQRVTDCLADEELSCGPYVLAGGELPALVVIEAVARLVPGVLGNPESLREESHMTGSVGEYPQYTKPAAYKGWEVPPVLLSGNHEDIRRWREEQLRKNDS